MIRINLLPVRQTRKLEALRREVALAAVLGVAIVGGFALIWGGLGIRLSAVSSDNSRLEAEIAKLAEDVKRVDEMEKYKAELQRKLEVIASLRARKSGPAHMLDELALAAPEKLQLKGVTESNGAVNITGVAVSNEIISQFLRALEASEYFEQVYLQNIEATDAAKQKNSNSSIVVKQFSLTARLVNPELAKLAAAEAEKGAKTEGKSDGKAGKADGGKDAKAAPGQNVPEREPGAAPAEGAPAAPAGGPAPTDPASPGAGSGGSATGGSTAPAPAGAPAPGGTQ